MSYYAHVIRWIRGIVVGILITILAMVAVYGPVLWICSLAGII